MGKSEINAWRLSFLIIPRLMESLWPAFICNERTGFRRQSSAGIHVPGPGRPISFQIPHFIFIARVLGLMLPTYAPRLCPNGDFESKRKVGPAHFEIDCCNRWLEPGFIFF
jgi:hypothetical protein